MATSSAVPFGWSRDFRLYTERHKPFHQKRDKQICKKQKEVFPAHRPFLYPEDIVVKYVISQFTRDSGYIHVEAD